MEPRPSGQRTGKVMLVAGWLLILAMLSWLFAGRLEHVDNPNSGVQTLDQGDRRELRLVASRGGHYVVPGTINGANAVFLLDTGASAVVVPESLASRYGLRPGPAVRVQTANGVITNYHARIERMQIGGIELYDVEAFINPAMSADDEILLGMSALSQLEMVQRGEELVLVQAGVSAR